MEKSQLCPHCGQAIALEAGSCPNCNRRTLFDLLTLFDLPDNRTAYYAARSLGEIQSQPHDFLTLKDRLQTAPGIVVNSVPRSIALVCQEKLAGFGVATQISHQPKRPTTTQGETPPDREGLLRRIRERPGTVFAMLLGIAMVAAIVRVVGDNSQPGSKQVVAPVSAEQLEIIAVGATVELTCKHRSGIGFFVTDKLVVTAAHVVCPSIPAINVRTHDGRTAQGRVVRMDPWLDVALIRTNDMTGQPLALADAIDLGWGDPVFNIDQLNDSTITVSPGTINVENLSILGTSYLEVQVGSNGGKAGGPLLDERGRAVGVVSMPAGFSGNQLLALPINYLVDGSDALLPGFFSDYAHELWRTRVHDAEAAGQEALAIIRSNPNKVGLVAARSTVPDSVDATIAQYSLSTPSDRLFSFSIRRGESLVCSQSGNTEYWQRVTSGGIHVGPSRYLTWLDRNGLLADVFLSTISLNTAECSDPSAVSGATLVLHNGVKYGDRVRIGTK